MRLLDFVLVLVVLAAAVWVIAGPLRAGRHDDGGELGPPPEPEPADELAGLEAAKESKYREIRDAELDFRTGKLSEPDYRSLDAELRAEAVEILRALDAEAEADQGSSHPTS